MVIGYARVSTEDQNLSLQYDALEKAGCEKIYGEKISGTKVKRPALDELLQFAREGDEVVVWRLDRLGRSMKELLRLIDEFKTRNIGFRSLNDSIDTTSAAGKLMFHIFAALAEFERNMTSERTKAGLLAARKRGRVGGRPKGLSKKAKHRAKVAKSYYLESDLSIVEICKEVNISRATLYKYLDHEKVELFKDKNARERKGEVIYVNEN